MARGLMVCNITVIARRVNFPTITSMPNYIRWRESGASYFFTVVTYRRRPLFNDARARHLLREALLATRQKWPFEQAACVLLPNHLHCLWTLPEHDDNYPARWAAIKRHFSASFIHSGGTTLPVTTNQAKHRQRGIWQPRYWEHRIRDEKDWYRHRDYIHLNPVKHNYVTDPKLWPFSSIHRHIELGWLDPDWPGQRAIDMPEVLGE